MCYRYFVKSYSTGEDIKECETIDLAYSFVEGWNTAKGYTDVYVEYYKINKEE